MSRESEMFDEDDVSAVADPETCEKLKVIISKAMEPYDGKGTCCKLTWLNLMDSLENIFPGEIGRNTLIRVMVELKFEFKFYWSEIDKMQAYWLVKMKDSDAIV